jgi:hypothetical protein
MEPLTRRPALVSAVVQSAFSVVPAKASRPLSLVMELNSTVCVGLVASISMGWVATPLAP